MDACGGRLTRRFLSKCFSKERGRTFEKVSTDYVTSHHDDDRSIDGRRDEETKESNQ